MSKTRLPRSRALLLLGLGVLAPAVRAAGGEGDARVAEGAEGADEPPAAEPEWDVNAPPGPSRVLPLDVREGTWMSLDVSPDGKELVFDLLGDLYALPIEGGEARALTSGMAWDMQPRYSPDGSRIAFTSDRGGGDNVWVMERDGSDARAVTQEPFRLLNSPAWTPDGAAIAARKHFTSRRSLGAGEIWLYHVGGPEENAGLQMTAKANQQKDLGEPAFSPDGRFLYYSYDATPGDTFEYSKDSTAGIYAIDRLDRATGEIARVAGGPGGACRPTPSPDGKKLAFVRRSDFVTALFVADLESGRAEKLYEPLERDMQETWAVHGVYPTMAWTPDGASIVLWAKGGLLRVDAATGAAAPIPFHVQGEREIREPVRSPVAVAPDEFEVKCLRDVVVSPAGDRVVYRALGALWTRDLPDGTPRRVTRDEGRFEAWPAFSRDGRKLAWVTWDDEELGAVWVADASGARRVTPEPGHYATPVFSPDGSDVYYRKSAGGHPGSSLWSHDPGIWRVSAAGGAPELVTRDGASPMFGADPDRLFVVRFEAQPEEDRHTLVAIRLSDRRETVRFSSKNAVEWALSPDGKWLAFSERYKTFVVPLVETGREVELGPGTKAVPLARVSRDAGENLQFSGDSSRLYWSLGPVLYERALTDAFAFLDGAPEELPEPAAEGRAISFTAAQAKPEGAWALVGAKLVTMRGDEVVADGTILVERDRIAAVGPRASVAVPAGTPTIDGRGLTVTPGLVDVHAHGSQGAGGMPVEANWEHHANLAFGVTTIHDPSHDTNAIFSAAELARTGRILAPRTFSTGTILYGAAGSYKAEVESLDDALAHLRRLQQVGAFSVKSYNQPRREQRQMVLEAARRLGMMVVPEGGSLFQHNLTMVVDGHTGIEHSLPVERVYDDVLQLWGPTPVGYTPTLVVGYGGIWGENYWYQHTDVWRNERLMHFAPRSEVEPRARRRSMAPEEDYNTLRSAGIAKALVDAGGGVQLGAHGQLAGLAAHWELWMFVQGGMTPHEALRSATLSGARYLGLDGDIGSLEPGKLADFVAFEADPLADVRDSEAIRWTVLGGRVLDARTLQTLDPRTGERGPAPRYPWRNGEAATGAAPARSTCGCGAGL